VHCYLMGYTFFIGSIPTSNTVLFDTFVTSQESWENRFLYNDFL